MQTKAQLPIATSSGNLSAFWVLAGLSLFLPYVPVVNWVLAPVTLFTTMVHELGHAIVCMLTGGMVTGLTIVSDGQGHGGLTNCLGGMPFLYTQAGYLGTAVFGAFLIFMCQFQRGAKAALCAIGTCLALSSFVLVGANVLHTGMQGFLSFICGLLLSAFLLWAGTNFKFAGIRWTPGAANVLMIFLAVQTALNSVTSLFYLTQATFGEGPWSDATNMQSMTGIPAIVWAVFWALCSVAMVTFAMWRTFGLTKKY
ncbi:MAG TPA: M50 family metallopeptidase [Trichormus sp.]|jgi:hypothetical protein